MSEARDRVRAMVERGKQVGKSLTVERGGRRIYTRVAVQKIDGRYKVIADAIDEAQMDAEVYEREDERVFDALDEAVAFIEGTTPVKLEDLAPSKGLKWF
ncbi:MAG: hypothetical protein QM820_41475 [Minicystis sp.]